MFIREIWGKVTSLILWNFDLGKFIPNFPLKHVITSTNKYGNNSRLLFTDTDSLMYEIKTEDVYEDFSNDKEMFDVSN